MKILIVDDEELTRSGLISSIDWLSLGISEVLEADDGLNGLSLARTHKPEIILCDVRMPRMDGIAMLEHLESLLPDSIPIFMSGYSDKEYLKAAIKLKALRYIEKPINLVELSEAVLEAKDLFLQKQRSHRGETLHSLETASRLALKLTTPYDANVDTIEQLTRELSLPITPSTFFTSFIVKLDTSFDLMESSKRDFFQLFEQFLEGHHLDCIYVEKHTQYLIYMVFGPWRPSSVTVSSIGQFLGRQYTPYGKYMIAAGESFPGIAKAYQSYSSAVILLQSSFFFPVNSFLTPTVLDEVPTSPLSALFSLESVLSEALSCKDQSAAENCLAELYSHLSGNHTLLPNQVKDFYYRLLLTLSNVRRQLLVTDEVGERTIADALESCFNFQELHGLLADRVRSFFMDLQSSVQENPTIFLIKDYISKNYMDVTLSVKDIGAHVHLSASYVCTFFKSETGQTLNQYLTEYRMERAKQLLGDLRYKISEISSKVGYSDGNYFGKSFKKYSGFSPSEYRENLLE